MQLLLISVFGMAGVLVRYFFGFTIARYVDNPFPYATFVINILGAFLIGFVHVAGAEKSLISPEIRMAITVGFLGGFTTFSAYCLDGMRLIETGRYGVAIVYLSSSSLMGLGATLCGFYLARRFIGIG